MKRSVVIIILVVLCCGHAKPSNSYEVVNSYPHDPKAFTQGLVFNGGFLYEGTGLYGSSSIRKVELESGVVLKSRELAAEYFGEGLTIFQDRLVQLTWRENRGFVYDLESFEPICTFAYESEGWGLTTDGKHLIMSDGSASLTYLDPSTYQVIKTIQVFKQGNPVKYLNELEFIEGLIYANIWLTNTIVLIEPQSGEVLAQLDLTELVLHEKKTNPQADVLNGIAFDPNTNRLWITGKLWANIYELRYPLSLDMQSLVERFKIEK